MTPENARLARLRGGLSAVEVGARGIESVARNLGCTRLRAIIISGLTPTEVIKTIFGAEPDIMLPFAMTVTLAYERRLLGNGGSSLLTAYREKGLLAQDEVKITSIEDLAPGDSVLARSRRVTETQRLIDMKHAGDLRAPNLILNPRVLLDLVGVSHPVELAYMVASDAEPSYRVGVIKSYADRGGKTNKSDIRSACREAAVGALALKQHIARRGGDPAMAGDRIDMVLRAPGSFNPRLFPAMRGVGAGVVGARPFHRTGRLGRGGAIASRGRDPGPRRRYRRAAQQLPIKLQGALRALGEMPRAGTRRRPADHLGRSGRRATSRRRLDLARPGPAGWPRAAAGQRGGSGLGRQSARRRPTPRSDCQWLTSSTSRRAFGPSSRAKLCRSCPSARW